MKIDVPETDLKTVEVVLEDPATGARLPGILRIPPAPVGWVIFAHGSGSSRFSPRNHQVATALNRRRIATLLFDLLTSAESQDRTQGFNIPLLAKRLLFSLKWVEARHEYNGTPFCFFGASTGSAAALQAASIAGSRLGSVISRGGRVDLARSFAPEVSCPVLLIVGGWDEPVLTWNRETLPLLKRGQLKVIPKATHLFEEPHALSSVIEAVTEFLERQFPLNRKSRPPPAPFP